MEVVLGAFLFSVMFGGLASGWVIHERASKRYRDRNMALVLARAEIERANAAGYAQLENFAITANGSNAMTVERSVDGVAMTRTYYREVTIIPESAWPNCSSPALSC